MNSGNTRESTAVVTGLGLVCVGLFLLVSLYTNSPYDVMDYHIGASGELENKAGWVGAWLAHYTLCTYGIGAWALMALTVVFGSWMCATKSIAGLLPRCVGAMMVTALICAWCGAMGRPAIMSAGYPAGPGGILGGQVLTPPLKEYFGPVGVFLILGVSSILSCMLMAPRATELALALLGRGITAAMHVIGDWIIGRMPNAMAPALAGTGPSPVMSSNSSIQRARVSKPISELDEAVSRVDVFPPAAEKARGVAAESIQRPKAEVVKIREDETTERKLPILNGRLADDADTNSKPEKAEKAEKAEKPEKVSKSEKAEKAESSDKLEKKQSKAELQAASDAEETERRRQEAVRQAEVAEAERLSREQQQKEQWAREQKALEKLEKERAAQDKERAKKQEKFNATIAEAEAKNAPKDASASAEEGADEAVAPVKPKIPIDYKLPTYEALIQNDITPAITSDTLKDRGATLIQTLWDFKIGAKLAGIQSGPTVTMYELELDPGIKVQKVTNLQDNLAMAMKAEHGVRIVAPIPGKATIGIEIPNSEDHTVRMRPILESPQFRSKSWTLPLILGRDAVGNPLIGDLATMPHLLIAGTTGSGKSVCVNSIILSIMILRKPNEVKLILVDPKQVEMTDFKGIPHLLSPVVTDMKMAPGVLTWAVQKMEQRYERMSMIGVRSIASFNRMTKEDRLARLAPDANPDDFIDPMPYIVIVVDEFADLMMLSGKEIEQAIARLAQKARAAGIHVILATQRPSADVVTGLIKSNLPCRICFQVKSKIDSRIVLDQGGADKLAGKGDMLFIGAGNSNLTRAKGVYIADDEIKNIVSFCKNQAEPEYSEEVERVAAQAAQGDDDVAEPENRQAIELDEKFDEGVETFLALKRASTSLLQRRMGLGYTRAAKLCDQMEARGIIGPDRGIKGRELLITQESWDQFKRARANNNGSAYGPKGSKDNPGLPAVSPAAVALAAEIEEDLDDAANGAVAAEVGEQVSPAMLDQLADVDGVKEVDEVKQDDE